MLAGSPRFSSFHWFTLVACAGVIAIVARVASALQFDEVGFTELINELGAAIPTGAEIKVSQIEVPNGNGHYGPITTNTEFDDVMVNPLSGFAGTSGHANNVGERFYGNSTSMAPGIDVVDVYLASDWWASGFLRTNQTSLEPKTETSRIQNHSWIGTLGNSSSDTNALRRLDYVVNEDNVFVTVGTNVGSNEPVPRLLGHFYNGLVVGTEPGDHASGFTTIDGAGRIKPDIVGPNVFPSFSTPMVGATAAVLIETAENTDGLSQAANNEALRAIILAGATKDEFSQWERTTTRPLDDHFGAGELNIYRSYHILADGQQPAGNVSLVQPQGWDFSTTASNSEYFFEVPAGMAISELSAVLVWNREIVNASETGFIPVSTGLKNLDLRFRRADNMVLGTVLDESTSSVDNVEHVYLNELRGMGELLFEGQYAFEVVSPVAGVDYSLAWFSAMQPVHQWSSFSADDDWANSGNWAAEGSPDIDWVARVDNVSTAGGQTATLSSDSTVYQVLVSGPGGRMTVAVESGSTLTAIGGVEINSGGAISGGGMIDGTLSNAGFVAIGAVEMLTVIGDAMFDDLELTVTDDYLQLRASETGTFAALSAGNVTGTVTTPPGSGVASHLGRGHFLTSLNVSSTQVEVDIFAALEGDADGDRDIDVTDFNILASNFDDTAMNADNEWTLGDFDDDGDIDITDFNALARNFSETGYVVVNQETTSIPEPSGFLLLLGMALLGGTTRWRR